MDVTTSGAAKTIHVFGSLNMDLVCQTPRLPLPGETLLGTQFQTLPGGKGANQAMAAARLGIPTTLVGRVGNDSFGQRLLQGLGDNGVNTQNVVIDETTPTGVASILVDATGQNQIVIVPGANGQVSDADLPRLAQGLKPGDLLLLQFEIPLPAVLRAAQMARERGVTVIVDPAPARTDLPDYFYGLVDILTPNQGEASHLVGFSVTDRDTAAAAAQALVTRGVGIAIVTLGNDGAMVASPDTCFHQPALPVAVVNTVAAGDAFNGGLAVALADSLPLKAAVEFATAVAAYVVTQPGAQSAMPTRSQVGAGLPLHP